MLHWDGKGWSAVASGTQRTISSLWVASPSDAWAVVPTFDPLADPRDPNSFPPQNASLLLHWDGSSWSLVWQGPTYGSSLVLGGGQPSLIRTVWGSGADDVWAVGASDGVSMLRWNGSAWSAAQPFPAGEYRGFSFSAIWGSGPADVWFGPSDPGIGLFHWDGTNWSFAPLYDPFSTIMSCKPHGLSGSGPSDVLMVGDWGCASHWDGTQWNFLPEANGAFYVLEGVWMSGPGDGWAVGAQGILYHWDGKSLSSAVSGVQADLYGVWGSGPRDVWTVGGGGTILHYQG